MRFGSHYGWVPTQGSRLSKIAFFLILVLGAPTSYGAEPLDRRYEALHLGMTPKAFQEAASSLELKQIYLNLLPGERFFKVTEAALSEGVANLTGRFYNDRLYKITVEYTQNWFDEAAWSSLIARQMDRYGKVPVQQKPLRDRIHEFVRWEDETTVHILRRELRMRFKDRKLVRQSVVVDIYLDKALWEERLGAETNRLF